MFIAAFWVLEQQQKAWDWLFPEKIPVDTPGHALAFGSLATVAGAQTAAIGSTPYVQMFHLAAREDEFLRKLHLHSPRSVGGKGIPSGFSLRPFGPKYMTASAGRKFAAKAVSRFVPYLGWGLLAVDLWNVGKWIGEKTS